MILRNDQLEALRNARENPPAWERAGRMVVDLEDLEFFERGSPSLEALLTEFRKHRPQPRGADADFVLRTLVAEEIDRALGYGIKTDLLLLHFVGFTFRYGLDWMRDKALTSLLEDPSLDEVAKLSELSKALRRR